MNLLSRAFGGDKSEKPKAVKHINLALQGGGALGAFTWGVLDHLLEDGRLKIEGISGASAGAVNAISIFTTTLSSLDNVAIVVPNAAVWGQTIKNYATNPTRRIDMTVNIAYSDNIQTAMDAIKRVLAADQRVLQDPAPTIAVGEVGNSAVNIVVRPWCSKDVYWDLRWDLTRALKEGLERAGCAVPSQQHDVHLFQESRRAA